MTAPRFTALITAHNAAPTIRQSLLTLAAQRGVAGEDFEVLLVDDRSDDGTLDQARGAGLPNLRTIRIDAPDGSRLTTRQQALARGIAEAHGEIVLTMDADGHAAPDWISSLTAPILAGRADAVAGPVSFRADRGWLGVWQTVDVAYYLQLCRLLNAVGLAGGVLFGNFAFRRDAYAATGGFEAMGFALTEDLEFSRALKRTGHRIAYVQGAAGMEVDACASWRVLIERAKRVSAGGFSALALVIGVWMASLPVLALAALVAPGWAGPLLAGRYLAGVAFSALSLVQARRWRYLVAALMYEPLAIAIGVAVVTRLSGSKHVEWGGRRYER